jgi:hypothetical protein
VTQVKPNRLRRMQVQTGRHEKCSKKSPKVEINEGKPEGTENTACPTEWGLLDLASPGKLIPDLGAAFSVPCVKRPDLLSGLSFFPEDDLKQLPQLIWQTGWSVPPMRGKANLAPRISAAY